MGRRIIVFDEAVRLISASIDGVTGVSVSLSLGICKGLAEIVFARDRCLDAVPNPLKEWRLSEPEKSSQQDASV